MQAQSSVPTKIKQAEPFLSNQDDDERQLARALDGKNPTDYYDIKYIVRLQQPYSSQGSWEDYGNSLKRFYEGKFFSSASDVGVMAESLNKFEVETFSNTKDYVKQYFGLMWKLISALSLVKKPNYIDLLQFLTEDGRQAKGKFEIEFSKAAANCLEEIFK